MQSRQSWTPLVVVSLTGLALVFNIASLTTAIGDLATDLGAPVSAIQLAIVTYSLLVAAFTVTGGKLSASLGVRKAHLIGLTAVAIGMAIVAFAPSINVVILGQGIAGLAAALLTPSGVAAIVEAYEGPQRTTAIVVQAAMTGILAAFSLLFGGAVVSLMGWRAPYLMLFVLLAVVMALATRLPGVGTSNAKLDFPSIGLSAAGVVFTIIGVNQTSSWGLVAAYPSAPLNLFGISPALLLVVFGMMIIFLFLSRQQRLRLQKRYPLLSPEVIESKGTIAGLLVLFAANLVVAGVVYLLLLYSQMVLGYSAIRSAVYVLPMSLAAFFAGASAPLLRRRASARMIVAIAYIVTAAATLLLAGAVSNTWNAPFFWLAEILIGGAIGVIFAVGSSVLIESAPEAISSEVGSARGVATFLGNALGIAISGAVLSSVLASTADLLVAQHPELSLPETITLSPANVQFVSNESLEEVLSRPPWDLATEQLSEAVQINVQARLLSLRASLTVLSLVSFVAVATVRALPSQSVAKRSSQGANLKAASSRGDVGSRLHDGNA